MIILESKDLVKRFGSQTAVDHVDLALEQGHIYGLLGPNGSGKTTWMKLAAGLAKPTSGLVLFNGRPVGIDSRRNIAYMSTEPYFYSWMRIRDAGKYYADFFEDFSSEEFDRLLAEMHLDPALKISSLSTGMTAKMKIAVTMARSAKVWMLDEPFNGIDLLARDEIRECILQRACKDNLILISSHLVEEMQAIVDRAVFISEGRLIEVRDLQEMQAREGISIIDRYRAIYGHIEEA